MSCIEIGVFLLSISICRPEPPPTRVAGRWVGTLESEGELKPLRADFVRGRSGLAGALHLYGAALALLKAGERRSGVVETGDDFVLVGILREDAIAGRIHHAGEQFPFELYRVPSGFRGHDTQFAVPTPRSTKASRLALAVPMCPDPRLN